MIYLTSDLHGYPLEGFLELLHSVSFSYRDHLFVLGDIIDRGEQGAELLRWMTGQPNVHIILGNHEAMLLSCDFVFDTVTDESISRLDSKKLRLLSTWLANGAQPTLAGLRRIMKEDPDIVEGILDCLRDAPLYETLDINGKHYILVHSGLENFEKQKPLDAYTPDELIWARPTMQTRYFDDAVVIFGHTPTKEFGEQYSGKVVTTDSWICLDTGTYHGNSPALLRLNDMQVFYI